MCDLANNNHNNARLFTRLGSLLGCNPISWCYWWRWWLISDLNKLKIVMAFVFVRFFVRSVRWLGIFTQSSLLRLYDHFQDTRRAEPIRSTTRFHSFMQSYSELLVRSCVQSSDPPHGFLQPQTCGAHWRTNHQPTIRTYVQRELIWFEASEQARKRVGCARMRWTCLKHAGLGFQHSGAIGPKTSRAFKFGLKLGPMVFAKLEVHRSIGHAGHCWLPWLPTQTPKSPDNELKDGKYQIGGIKSQILFSILQFYSVYKDSGRPERKKGGGSVHLYTSQR